MKVLFDTTDKRVLEAQDPDSGIWYVLEGECIHCGECCKRQGCKNLLEQTLDDKVHNICSIQSTKPCGCAVWPRRPVPKKEIDELLPTCGFSWRRK